MTWSIGQDNVLYHSLLELASLKRFGHLPEMAIIAM
jgi:hypothetical protein